MDKANNPPSDGDENVSYFDCERDCEMEFVASAFANVLSPKSDDEDGDDRIIKQS